MDLGNLVNSHKANFAPADAELTGRPDPDFASYYSDLNDGAEEPPQRDESLRLANTTWRSEAAADNNNNNYFQSPRVESPGSCSPISEQSMNSNARNLTPPESPKPESPRERTATGLSRLSLDNNNGNTGQQCRRGRSPLGPDANLSTKRAASNDLDQPPAKVPSGARGPSVRTAFDFRKLDTFSFRRIGTKVSKQGAPGRRSKQQNIRHGGYGASLGHVASTNAASKVPSKAVQRDSGYYSQQPSREPTMDQETQKRTPAAAGGPIHRSLSSVEEHPYDCPEHDTDHVIEHSREPVMLLQPDSSPISKEQLAAEVKGIYAGLVMVEAKCINIDKAQAADMSSQLNAEQWQALIALHRTLLYEHHDFLMATQHPSSTPALRGLASKYSMPARMWRHGIHAFLEVLRHRRPQSQDYMLAFVYLAYQMMALLFETVPGFTDTWIECLGDLARYRMAIEDDREIHTVWGGVAARWYNTASFRNPNVGRLYHHLGILERPSLRKLSLYAKSLTSVIPFANAKDSMTTLCAPILQDGMHHTEGRSWEVLVVTFHAHVFMQSETASIENSASEVLSQQARQPVSKLRTIGVELVATNVAALLEFGSYTNIISRSFDDAISTSKQLLSYPGSGSNPSTINNDRDRSSLATSVSSTSVHSFCYNIINSLFEYRNDRQSLRGSLPSVLTALVWMHGVYSLMMKVTDDRVKNTCNSLLDPERFCWGGLCEYLNELARTDPINARTIEKARQDQFLSPERNDELGPLPEDYTLRGLMWSYFYFPIDWFDKDAEEAEGWNVEKPEMHCIRAQRVHWLGAFLAFRLPHLAFNASTRSFTAPQTASPIMKQPLSSQRAKPHTIHDGNVQRAGKSSPQSRSSTTISAHTDSDGYEVLTSPKVKPTKTWAKIASKPTKRRLYGSNVQIFGEGDMEMEL